MGSTHWRASAKFHCDIKGLWAESPATHEHCRDFARGFELITAKAWDAARILALPTGRAPT